MVLCHTSEWLEDGLWSRLDPMQLLMVTVILRSSVETLRLTQHLGTVEPMAANVLAHEVREVARDVECALAYQVSSISNDDAYLTGMPGRVQWREKSPGHGSVFYPG